MNIRVKLLLFSLLFFHLVICIFAKIRSSVEVKGTVFTGLNTKIDGKQIDYFLGIPYAKPPIGWLRFRKPEPIEYEKPVIATQYGNPCIQSQDFANIFVNKNISEDCLYLNIWSPKKGKQLKPVMFFIHGGSFQVGSASYDLFNGEILAARGDVLVVTINYRLQAFGFLYTGTESAPGNVGLWDQALALEWVRNNIKYFGGDRNRITIFGESAGSWSVSVHLLSPITRDLFQNAIMMSGAAIGFLGASNPNQSKQFWLQLSNLVGCGDGNEFTNTVIECLRQTSAQILYNTAFNPILVNYTFGLLPDIIYGDEFLPERPIDMLLKKEIKKNVRLLSGDVRDEGSIVLNLFNATKYSPNNPINLTKAEAYKEIEYILSVINTNTPINANDVTKLYLSRLPNNDYYAIRLAMAAVLGDYAFDCPTKQFSKAVYEADRQHNRVYEYIFKTKFLSNNTIQQTLISFCGKDWGVCHESDLIPVFGYPLRYRNQFYPKEILVSIHMIDIFTNFAKNGYPPPQEGIDWLSMYSIRCKVIQTYYEIEFEDKPNGNFVINQKIDECERLWKYYIDRQGL